MTQRFLMSVMACGSLSGLPVILDSLGILPSCLEMDSELASNLTCPFTVRRRFLFPNTSMYPHPACLSNTFV